MDRQATFGYVETRKESMCVRCRGFMALCGRGVCPILAKARTYAGMKDLASSIAGSAPPAVFVGSYGYPRVIAGPLSPLSRAIPWTWTPRSGWAWASTTSCATASS